ncbi:VOC family protein [Bradyrhizobium sp. Arg68]|uniref:VOC family protein n=1 Tax=Bradyrhizobium ivorense TaxID=2511166 RepID=UPI001E3562FC|nr:VOC family protein [Bradyrhizobium ivorense]MCC8938877.1 VOC family protein [Bradyrhizobium ivorense]
MLDGCSPMTLWRRRDSARARAFYEGVLGLQFVCDDDFAVVYDLAGIELRVQKVRALIPQPHTVLGWAVPDIDAAVRGIAARGGVFERYPRLAQDELGVWPSPSGARIAWLKDPGGNVLSIIERP